MAIDPTAIAQMAQQQNQLQPNSGSYLQTVAGNIGNKNVESDWARGALNVIDFGGGLSNTMDYFSGGKLFGGSDGDEETAPTLREIMQEYPGIIQDLMDFSQTMAPQQAQLQLDMQNQFMPGLLQSQQNALESVYPQAAGLTELLAGQATEQMSGELTDAERRQFMDVQKSLVGGQSTAGIGTDYIGSNMLNYVNQRQQNAQQLGLQTAGMIPQTTLQSPNYTDYSQQFSPSQFLGGSQNQQQMAYNQASTSSDSSGGIMGMLGSIIGGLGGSSTGSTGNAVNYNTGTSPISNYNLGVNSSQLNGAGNTGINNGKYYATPLSYGSINGLGGSYYGS